MINMKMIFREYLDFSMVIKSFLNFRQVKNFLSVYFFIPFWTEPFLFTDSRLSFYY